MSPLIALHDQKLFTRPLGLATLLGSVQSETIAYGMMMTGAFLPALPIVLRSY